MKSNTGKNLQVNQEGIVQPKPNDGWPEPLADTSNPVKFAYTTGKSGSVTSKKIGSDCADCGKMDD